jgi:hypothetical protein
MEQVHKGILHVDAFLYVSLYRRYAGAICLRLIPRYESHTTKSPELNFSALVGDDGARNVRFERALRT